MPVGATTAVARSCSYPKSNRLRKRADYLAVQRGGKTLHNRYFVVVMVEQAAVGGCMQGPGRLGITVSKKVGNAVTRNRVKRVVREFVRGAGPASSDWLPEHRDVVVIAKKAAASASTKSLWSVLESCRSALHRESSSC